MGTLNCKTGHLTKIIDNLNNAKNREYQFDALGRLTVAKGKASNQWTQTYTYDRFGNRTSVTAAGTAADGSTMPADGIPNLTFDAASNRITTSGFLYDAAGNQTRALAPDGVTWVKYEYDAANRVYQIKKDDAGQTLLQVFQFGSSNQRLIDYDPTGTGRNTFYATVGGTVLAEYTEYAQNTLSWTKTYTYLGDSQLSTITPNGSGGEYTEYNHPDKLGTRLITSQSAGTNYEQAHLPFGKALNAESTITTNNKRFTTYDRSAPTGLDYAVNRTYDSKQGRFTQVDPIGMSASSLAAPQTLNLYTYCGNDPINYTDPGGLFFGFLKKLLKWVVTAIAVIVAVIAVVAAIYITAGALGAVFAGTGFAATAGGIGMTTGVIGAITSIAGAAMSVYNAVGSIANHFAGDDDDEIIRIEIRCKRGESSALCEGFGIPKRKRWWNKLWDGLLDSAGGDSGGSGPFHFIGFMLGGLATRGGGRGGGKRSVSPKSIQDQMTMSAAKRGEGDRIMGNKTMDDPRYLGWEKIQLTVKADSGATSSVHYVRNPRTGEMADFKFKKHSDGTVIP